MYKYVNMYLHIYICIDTHLAATKKQQSRRVQGRRQPHAQTRNGSRAGGGQNWQCHRLEKRRGLIGLSCALMYMYIHKYIHTHIYIYIYIYIYTYTHTHTYVICIYLCISICIYVYIHLYIHLYISSSY